VRLRDEWTLGCPSCGRAFIFTEQVIGKQMTCSGCNSNYSYPKILTVKKFTVPLFPGKKLYACQTNGTSDDYATITAEIVMNKNNPSLGGIKNLSADTWKMKTPDGIEKEAPPQGGIPIGAGVEVEFSGATGIIGEQT
jgi:hypothetical protein